MSKRSLKIDGVTTSIFLEDPFWHEVGRWAHKKHMTETQFIRSFLAEEESESVSNRSSYIKMHMLELLRADYEKLLDKQLESTWIIEELGEPKRRELLRGDVISVGAGENNDIILNDQEVRSSHCLFVFNQARWWAFALDEASPLYFNDEGVTTVKLPRRAELKIGSSYITRA